MPAYYQSTHSILILAPPEKVYKALTDWIERSQWRKGITLEWDGGSKAHQNQKVTFRVKGIIPYSFSFRVSGLEPPHRFYMEYTRTLRGRSAVEITPEGSGCHVAFHWMKVEPAGFWPRFYFALGLGMKTHRARTMETLQMLKEYLEKSGESA